MAQEAGLSMAELKTNGLGAKVYKLNKWASVSDLQAMAARMAAARVAAERGGVHARRVAEDGTALLEAAAREIVAHVAGGGAGILFGRERFGLFNEEVALADEIVTFPVNPAFASLNIAQAVLLMSYEWMKSGMEDVHAVPFQAPEQPLASKEEVVGLFEHLEEALDARNYFHPPHKKAKMVDNLRAVLSRRAFTGPEIHVLRGIVSSLDRFTRAGQKAPAAVSQEIGRAHV